MTEPLHVAEMVCPNCGTSVPFDATTCPRCGAALGTGETPVAPGERALAGKQPVAPAARAPTRLEDRRWVVISLMVFAALFLGLPILWRSRGFSRAEKVFWTIAVLVETVIVFWLFFYAMDWAIRNIRDALA